jgi:tetratricopeptide (TPR) repeat protein
LEKWILDDSRKSNDPLRRTYLQRYALIAMTMDRAVNDELPALIDKIGNDSALKVKSVGIMSHGTLVMFERDGVDTQQILIPPDVAKEQFKPGDVVPSELALFAAGYNAIRSGDHERAYEKFLALVRIYPEKQFSYQHYAFPYLVRAASKAGKLNQLEMELTGAKNSELEFSVDSDWFDYHLGRAFILSGSGDNDTALRYLDWAFNIKPFVKGRPVMPWFQMVEASLWLYEDSGDPRYLSRALSWARRYQSIAPMYAWASSVVGRFSDDPEEKQQSLGIALFLDPQSHILSDIPESERQAARAAFEQMRSQSQSQEGAPGGKQSSSGGIKSGLQRDERGPSSITES